MSDEQGEAVGSADADGEESAGPGGDPTEAGEPTVDVEELRARVAERPPEETAEELAALEERVEALEAERDDLESRLKRKQAEFQNYKKRQEKRREDERARATESLVERLVDVRDNLQRALEQGDDADIREGVEATFRQLEDILRAENVEPIEPEPGTDVDPTRHEVLLRVESDHPPDTVAGVHRPGYEMAGKVLRPAQVTVSEGGGGSEGENEGEATDDEDTDESEGGADGADSGEDDEATAGAE